MAYVVDHGVPIPPKTFKPRPSTRIYPFHDMEIGDSFGFPREKLDSVRRSASRYQNAYGVTFIVSGLSLRCWRTD